MYLMANDFSVAQEHYKCHPHASHLSYVYRLDLSQDLPWSGAKCHARCIVSITKMGSRCQRFGTIKYASRFVTFFSGLCPSSAARIRFQLPFVAAKGYTCRAGSSFLKRSVSSVGAVRSLAVSERNSILPPESRETTTTHDYLFLVRGI